MRWKLLWYSLVAAGLLASYFLNFDWPPSVGAVMAALTPVETWWAAHAANPLLSAFFVGIGFGTILLPQLWRQVRPHVFPIKLRPDISGPEGFKSVLNQSKRSKELIKKGLLTTPLRYESHLSKDEIIEGRLRKTLAREFHDLLRLGEITAWGTQDGKKPYEKILPDSWSTLEIDFSDFERSENPALHAVKNGNQSTGTAYGYVWIKFCGKELYNEFPLSWWPRKVATSKNTERQTPNTEIKQPLQIEERARIEPQIATNAADSSSERFLSLKEREELATALFELKDVFSRIGESLSNTISAFLRNWYDKRSSVSSRGLDASALLTEIRAFRGQLSELHIAIFDEEGILKQHPAFPELRDLIGKSAIDELQISASRFESALVLAEKITDRSQLELLTWAVMEDSQFRLAQAESAFRGWVLRAKEMVSQRQEELRS